jgi:predicted permease
MLLQDFRYAARTLWKARSFTIAAVLTLALGMGVNAAVFILYNAALYETLPARNPSELSHIVTWTREGGDHFDFSYPLYVDFRDAAGTHDGLAAYSASWATVAAANRAEQVVAEYVTFNYFDVLGVPVAGPGFHGRDELARAAPVAIIGEALWQRLFGEDSKIAGKTVAVNGRSFAIAGVAPRGFDGLVRGQRADLWLPVSQSEQAVSLGKRTQSCLSIVARVRPDTSRARVAAQLTAVYRATSIDPMAGQQEVRLLDGSRGATGLVDSLNAPLRLLIATVGLILVIASANVANLLLVRSQQRRREIAIRQAIGASRYRIARQLLAESAVLAITGGALGLLLALWLVAAFEVRPAPTALPLTLRLEPSTAVLLFTAVLSMCVALAAGLAPALLGARGDLMPVIRRETQGTVAMTSGRKALAVVQIALCLVLMVGSGLFLRSLSRLRAVDPSLMSDRLVAATLNLTLRGYEREAEQQLYADVLRQVRGTPGIQAATLAYVLPVTAGGMRENLNPGLTDPPLDVATEFDIVPVADGFFETVGIPLLRGRDFSNEPSTPRVIIVNETFKERFWPGAEAVGERFSISGRETFEVIGIARDSKYRNLRERPRLTIYQPLTQEHMSTIELVVRSALPKAPTAEALRTALRRVDSQLPLYNVRTMADHVNRSLYLDQLRAVLISALAILALLI